MKGVFSTILITISLVINGQDFDVFHLSIGSAHYSKESQDSFDDISGARRSARYVHELLTEKAGSQGSMLRSEAGQPLTKKQIIDELKQTIKLAKKSKSKRPLIVLYFCGHGVSEGLGWSQFLVPGEFKEVPAAFLNQSMGLDLDRIRKSLLYVGDLSDLLLESKIPYTILADACYEGKAHSLSVLEQFFNDTAMQNIRDMVGIVKFMNEFHTENPVVFATPPGTVTKVVEDPLVPEGVYIGPICRKLILVSGKLEELETMSLMDVVLLLSDEAFDPLTPNVTSNYEFDEKGLWTLLKEEDE